MFVTFAIWEPPHHSSAGTTDPSFHRRHRGQGQLQAARRTNLWVSYRVCGMCYLTCTGCILFTCRSRDFMLILCVTVDGFIFRILRAIGYHEMYHQKGFQWKDRVRERLGGILWQSAFRGKGKDERDGVGARNVALRNFAKYFLSPPLSSWAPSVSPL